MRYFLVVFGVAVFAVVLTLSDAAPQSFSGFGSKSGQVEGSANFSFEVAGYGQGQGQGSANGGRSMVKRELSNHVHTASCNRGGRRGPPPAPPAPPAPTNATIG